MLTVECGYYLPSYKSITIYFMKDIMSMQKKAVKNSQVQFQYAPMYPSLSIEEILRFASQFHELRDYWPDPREMHSIPR